MVIIVWPSPWSGSLQWVVVTFRKGLIHINGHGVNVTPQHFPFNAKKRGKALTMWQVTICTFKIIAFIHERTKFQYITCVVGVNAFSHGI